MNLINLFPLTILKDKIDISDDEKALMINEIRDMKKNSKNTNYQTKTNAWTGDTQGFEYIFKNEKFSLLLQEIKKIIINECLTFLNKLFFNTLSFLSFPFFASLAIVVVFPDPFTPKTSITCNSLFGFKFNS